MNYGAFRYSTCYTLNCLSIKTTSTWFNLLSVSNDFGLLVQPFYLHICIHIIFYIWYIFYSCMSFMQTLLNSKYRSPLNPFEFSPVTTTDRFFMWYIGWKCCVILKGNKKEPGFQLFSKFDKCKVRLYLYTESILCRAVVSWGTSLPARELDFCWFLLLMLVRLNEEYLWFWVEFELSWAFLTHDWINPTVALPEV